MSTNKTIDTDEFQKKLDEVVDSLERFGRERAVKKQERIADRDGEKRSDIWGDVISAGEQAEKILADFGDLWKDYDSKLDARFESIGKILGATTDATSHIVLAANDLAEATKFPSKKKKEDEDEEKSGEKGKSSGKTTGKGEGASEGEGAEKSGEEEYNAAQERWESLVAAGKDVENIMTAIGEVCGEESAKVVKGLGGIANAGMTMANGVAALANKSVSMVNGVAGATKTATGVAAQSMGAVEKASVILTIISAAVQIAAQIMSMIKTGDQKKEEKIQAIGEDIKKLKGELENIELKRLEAAVGSFLDRVKAANNGISGAVSTSNEELSISAEKLADAYARMDQTAGKLLGSTKYEGTRDELENIAKQQLLIREQMELEDAKKNTSSEKMAEYQKQIEELGMKARETVEKVAEGLLGGSLESTVAKLAKAMIEVFEKGGDMADAWGRKVNEIIKEMVKKLIITKVLEEPLTQIVSQYVTKMGIGKETNPTKKTEQPKNIIYDDLIPKKDANGNPIYVDPVTDLAYPGATGTGKYSIQSAYATYSPYGVAVNPAATTPDNPPYYGGKYSTGAAFGSLKLVEGMANVSGWTVSTNNPATGSIEYFEGDTQVDRAMEGSQWLQEALIAAGIAGKDGQTGGLFDVLQKTFDGLDGIFGTAEEEAGSTTSSRSAASAQGLAAASQDSVTELNGRMTVMQMHTAGLLTNSNTLVEHSVEIMRQWGTLQSHNEAVLNHLSGIHTHTTHMEGYLQDISTRGVYIRQ